MSYPSEVVKEWKKNGTIKYVIWQTVNDEQVCAICRERDNEQFLLDEIESLLPAHEGCRCYIKPVVSYELFAQEIDKILAEPEPKKKRKLFRFKR